MATFYSFPPPTCEIPTSEPSPQWSLTLTTGCLDCTEVIKVIFSKSRADQVATLNDLSQNMEAKEQQL